jgi:uncharacterized peroxidase-related enzyme
MQQPFIYPKQDLNDPALQELIKFYNETLGFCPNSVKTMHFRPKIALAFIELNKAVMENFGRVTSSLKRLIGYLSSQIAGCEYCQAHTIRAAERYGATIEQLEKIWEYKTHPSFSDAEKAAFDFAIAASAQPNAVNDEIAQNMRIHWNEGEIVEILGVVALFGYLNRWNDSMGTTIEDGAYESGQKLLSTTNWSGKKHQY